MGVLDTCAKYFLFLSNIIIFVSKSIHAGDNTTGLKMKIRCTWVFVKSPTVLIQIGWALNLNHWSIGSGFNINNNDDEDEDNLETCNETNDDKSHDINIFQMLSWIILALGIWALVNRNSFLDLLDQGNVGF